MPSLIRNLWFCPDIAQVTSGYKHMLKKIGKAFDGFMSFLENLAAVVLVLLVFAITLHVVFRYLLNSPFIWTTQFASYTLLLFTSFGAGQLLKLDRHVNIEIFVSRLNEHFNHLINFITSIFGVLICIVVVWFGIITTAEQAAKNTLVMDSIIFPQYYLTIFIPFTFFILGLQFVRRTCEYYIKLKKSKVEIARKQA